MKSQHPNKMLKVQLVNKGARNREKLQQLDGIKKKRDENNTDGSAKKG